MYRLYSYVLLHTCLVPDWLGMCSHAHVFPLADWTTAQWRRTKATTEMEKQWIWVFRSPLPIQWRAHPFPYPFWSQLATSPFRIISVAAKSRSSCFPRANPHRVLPQTIGNEYARSPWLRKPIIPALMASCQTKLQPAVQNRKLPRRIQDLCLNTLRSRSPFWSLDLSQAQIMNFWHPKLISSFSSPLMFPAFLLSISNEFISTRVRVSRKTIRVAH